MAARTPTAVSQDIRAKLNTTLPGLSLEIGTPERKIVDAVSEAVSEAYIDQYSTGTVLDIDTKSGIELEQFVGLFGFGRLEGRKATGTLRMELTSIATQATEIPKSVQFYVPQGGVGGGDLYFYSTAPAVLPQGVYSTDIPVECTIAGSVGNVAPGTVTSLGTTIGSASVTNLTSMTGGVDTETDNELRTRFKNTFLRNIAGTFDYYNALCLQNRFVSKVVVYGPVTTYRTQVAAPASSVNVPITSDVKYVWNSSQSIYKDLGQDTEVFYSPSVDYTFTGGTVPSLVRNAGGVMVAGDIIDVEFEYTTKSSRNDPVNGLTNKIDIFVDGTDPYTVSERTVVSAQVFSTTSSNELYTGNFTRVIGNVAPSSANRFMRLGSMPVVAFPSTITVASTTYTEGVHYYRVRGTTLLAGSNRDIAGIEWLPAGPASGTALTLTYSYNRVPELLNAQMRKAKQITTDVLVHQADYRYVRVYLSVEFNRGMVVSQVLTNIQTMLRNFFASFGYAAVVEMSDITSIVHQVVGVDNVWITTSTENASNYGVRVYSYSDDVTPLATQIADFIFADNQLPVFLDAVVTRKANTR